MISRKKYRYTYVILLAIRIGISFHVGYLYTSYSSSNSQGKGGTFVEATLKKVNYLPYITNDDNDIFYQSFFFNGCIYPSFSGTNIIYREELCSVTTDDYQTFTVIPNNQKYRADGTAFTLNDIYFTYNTIIKENYRNRGFLDSYQGINVTVNKEEGSLQVRFPKRSVDNMIFFTNFILPSHLLANKSLETYFTTFYRNPIGTNCASLAPSVRDTASTIFDLSACQDVSLKFYQTKQFQDVTQLTEYIHENPKVIDIILDGGPYTGYQVNTVILNKFITLFFNTKRVNKTLRQTIGSIIAHNFYTEKTGKYIVEDHFLFDAFLQGITHFPQDEQENVLYTNIKIGLFTGGNEQNAPSEDLQNTLQELPTKINRDLSQKTQSYKLSQKIVNKKTLQFFFPKKYSSVSVTANSGKEYFPRSYNKIDQYSFYNLNPLYRNIKIGENTYIIKGYNENNEPMETYTLHITYLSELYKNQRGKKGASAEEQPTQQNTITNTTKPLQVIFLENKTNNAVIERLKEIFAQYGIEENFVFHAFNDANTFAGKIESGDYDIVLRSINMGLRKDISNIFSSESPKINPSLYKNEHLSTLSSEYFLKQNQKDQQNKIKKQIDEIYYNEIPFVILGKELGSLHINKQKKQSFSYPLRLYVLGRRKDFIKDLPVFQHISIDRDRLKSIDNFKSFLVHQKIGLGRDWLQDTKK